MAAKPGPRAGGRGRPGAPKTRRGGRKKPALRIRLKRAYERPAPDDGRRVLVDRVWPRGVSKASLRVDEWLPDLGPSPELRKWFGHDPAKWDAFRRRYRAELAGQRSALSTLAEHARGGGMLTLVFGSRDVEHNQAVVIRDMLEQMAATGSRTRSGAARRERR